MAAGHTARAVTAADGDAGEFGRVAVAVRFRWLEAAM
jgi:hypothetical protein